MLLIHCPYCQEERSELEFRGAGDAHIARPTDMASISDEEFEAYFFLRDNPKGLIFERWRHIHGCGRFFNAVRDTVSDKFIMTYKAGEPKPDLGAAAEKHAPVETYEALEGEAQ
ncbi:sarcosine oxidase subunit delta [Rhizobium binae]|uniref:Sarcosine oxidase subunit delta n=1 Tax=Rhizobium binae TaxID=1138190 RepID=A0ABV2MKA0_9HYPH|nr:sarcosine oxidase subunit delta [Rhizobium binae]MBX4991240.1 sarcosine oxidase subunit delta [Rhizobium binae]NKL50469.1 sarcosine oxidase subunit delta family protein [Rhizobium leguminosarum bv. viciae]QSY81730.1 sarcosine oxidase subunit delta [Rhizobium binae]